VKTDDGNWPSVEIVSAQNAPKCVCRHGRTPPKLCCGRLQLRKEEDNGKGEEWDKRKLKGKGKETSGEERHSLLLILLMLWIIFIKT